ncbi:hypothetical protein [Pseudomonas putida]|uniref:hypothetical protein n=1 Tax=Pseudomonas putida TaxID=303 RepID=UPI0015DC37C1|nr:hypothetical protein [Pseudomonas putida]BBR52750.1 hypothetical protein WP4W18C03_10770 [Pseudomonas putida]
MNPIHQTVSDAVCLIAKKPLTTGRRNLRVTHFPSEKNSMMIACDSLLNAKFCVHFEYEKDIVNYVSRPWAIRFLKHNLTVHPDFRATWADGKEVYYQVCQDISTLAPYTLSQFTSAKNAFLEEGLALELINVTGVQHTICTETLRTLYFHSQGGLPKESLGINETLKLHFDGRAKFRDLIGVGIPTKHIAYGVFHQALHANLTCPVNLDMIVEARS